MSRFRERRSSLSGQAFDELEQANRFFAEADRVVDAQGLAIPGATVIVTGARGSRTFVTDPDGRFLAPFLTPGRYSVRVDRTRDGF